MNASNVSRMLLTKSFKISYLPYLVQLLRDLSSSGLVITMQTTITQGDSFVVLNHTSIVMPTRSILEASDVGTPLCSGHFSVCVIEVPLYSIILLSF